jgi:hypothetical protein
MSNIARKATRRFGEALGYRETGSYGKLPVLIGSMLRIAKLKVALKAADQASTGRILVQVVKLCYESREWKLLNEHVILLSKKHGQLKAVSSILISPVGLNMYVFLIAKSSSGNNQDGTRSYVSLGRYTKYGNKVGAYRYIANSDRRKNIC